MKLRTTRGMLGAIASGSVMGLAILCGTPGAAQELRIVFNNRIAGVVIAPIYGLEPADPHLCKQGNTATGYPPGTQVYDGELLAGQLYTAQLFLGMAGTGEDSMIALTPSTSFRISPSAGFVIPVTNTVPGVFVPGTEVTLQMRVWDNNGGTVLSWDEVKLNPSLPRGRSALWVAQVPEVGFPPPTLPMSGLRSFNLCILATAPNITDQPASQVVSEGTPVCFTVKATGTPPLQYQWLLNGTPIQGATDSTYCIPHAATQDAGTYVARVSDSGGSSDSQPATLALLGLHVCAVLTLDGPVGAKYRIDYSPAMAATPAWTALDTVTLTSSPFHYIDWGSSNAVKRYYRTVPLP